MIMLYYSTKTAENQSAVSAFLSVGKTVLKSDTLSHKLVFVYSPATLSPFMSIDGAPKTL